MGRGRDALSRSAGTAEEVAIQIQVGNALVRKAIDVLRYAFFPLRATGSKMSGLFTCRIAVVDRTTTSKGLARKLAAQ